jgi:hypothetical protein
MNCQPLHQEEFEDTKGVNQNPLIDEDQVAKRKSTKGQTTVYKTYT